MSVVVVVFFSIVFTFARMFAWERFFGFLCRRIKNSASPTASLVQGFRSFVAGVRAFEEVELKVSPAHLSVREQFDRLGQNSFASTRTYVDSFHWLGYHNY